MMVDVSYIGNHGSRLNHHWQTLGVDANMNSTKRAGAGNARPAVEHQLGSGACRRHSVAIRGIQRQRRAGAADSIRSTRTSSGAACRPARVSTTPSSSSSSAGSPMDSSGASATRTRTCITTARRARRGTTASTGPCRTRRTRCRGRLSFDDTPHVFLTGFTWEVPGPSGGLARNAARRLARQRHPAVRERPAAEHHDEQRPRGAALQRSEAAEPGIGH